MRVTTSDLILKILTENGNKKFQKKKKNGCESVLNIIRY